MTDKVTTVSLQAMKRGRRPIVALTTYDMTTTRLLNQAGADLLLVGDSLGMVKLGYASTLPVTVEDILYHTRTVARGNSRALLVADMPFLSYQASVEEAVRNCGKMLKAGAEAIKLEGGKEYARLVRTLRGAGIPVLGHLGMTPQSVNVFGGYKVQGRKAGDRHRILSDARALEAAGAFAVVLECVPRHLARRITRTLRIPTIGIGAGPDCDGQILVIDDVLGLTVPPLPRFVKRYADLRETILRAARAYASDVRRGVYPDLSHSYE